MPSLEHNGLAELFRENPPLAPHFLEMLFGMTVPQHASVGVVDSSLDQLVPVEFRADLVVELKDEKGKVVLSIILEVQRDMGLDKKFSWPVYLALERARKRCPVIVLVIATDGSVAEWAAANIDMGLGLANVRPLVLGPAVVPRVEDQAVADREVELSILSALTHGNEPDGIDVVRVAVRALERLDPEHAAVYFQIIYAALREPLKKAMERLIMERQTQLKGELPPFLQQIKLEGKLEGKLDGKLEGKRTALLRLMRRAGLELTDVERARIEGCADVDALDRWLDNLFGAKTAAEVLG